MIILDYVYYYVKHEVLISHVNNNVVIKRPSPDIIYFTYKFLQHPRHSAGSAPVAGLIPCYDTQSCGCSLDIPFVD